MDFLSRARDGVTTHTHRRRHRLGHLRRRHGVGSAARQLGAESGERRGLGVGSGERKHVGWMGRTKACLGAKPKWRTPTPPKWPKPPRPPKPPPSRRAHLAPSLSHWGAEDRYAEARPRPPRLKWTSKSRAPAAPNQADASPTASARASAGGVAGGLGANPLIIDADDLAQVAPTTSLPWTARPPTFQIFAKNSVRHRAWGSRLGILILRWARIT